MIAAAATSTPEERAANEAEGLPSVIRFAAPIEGTTTYHDFLRGDITFDNSTIDDMILLKSDGYPTYNFANIIDDHLMDITHVIRGEEYISSAPRYAQVYRAFGWEEPTVVHVPLVLLPTARSWRSGMARCRCWTIGTRAICQRPSATSCCCSAGHMTTRKSSSPCEEMVEAFDDRRIGTSPAIFDVTRLDWFNGHYIRALSPERLTELALPFLLKGLPEDVAATVDPAYARQVFVLDQERFKTLADVPLLTSFFFIEQPEYDARLLLGKGMDVERATQALDAVIAVLGEQSEWTPEALLRALDGTVERLGYMRTKADGSQVPDRGPVFMLVRVGVSGRKETPGLAEMMTVLGRERVLRRLQAAMEKLQTLAG